MFLTYQYRLRPTRAQHRALERILEMQRLLYNAGLEERISAYRRQGLSIGWKDQSASLTAIRADDPDGYGALPVALSRWTLVKLDQAMKAFFSRAKTRKGKAGFPRFRAQSRFRSFGLTEWKGVSLDAARARISLKGMAGALRLHMHRPLPADARIRAAIVTRDAKGWRIGLQIETAAGEIQAEPLAVGVDVGVAALATLSTGEAIANPRVGENASKAVRKAQRALARCKRGSNRRRKVKAALARRLEKVARTRTTHLHQAAAALTARYGRIVVEDLSLRNMTRSAKGSVEEPGKNVAQKTGLNRSILDASFARFVEFLSYKAERAGGEVIRVDPRKTSIACSACGVDVPKSLSVREHRCPACGFAAGRDHNAAINILGRGLAVVSGRAGRGPGVDKPLAGEARPGNLMMEAAE